jgi:hypothetical protein
MAGGPYKTDEATLAAGQGALVRLSALGKKTLGAATASAVTGTDGVIGAVTLLAGAKVGVYTFTCRTAIGSSGLFQVVDPDGIGLADLLVGTAYADHLSFTVADGNADFIVGDSFTVTVAAGSGQLMLLDSTALDGSQKIHSILAEATDATSAALAPIYLTGSFVESALTFGGTDTFADHADDARALGIHFVTGHPVT